MKRLSFLKTADPDPGRIIPGLAAGPVTVRPTGPRSALLGLAAWAQGNLPYHPIATVLQSDRFHGADPKGAAAASGRRNRDDMARNGCARPEHRPRKLPPVCPCSGLRPRLAWFPCRLATCCESSRVRCRATVRRPGFDLCVLAGAGALSPADRLSSHGWPQRTLLARTRLPLA